MILPSIYWVINTSMDRKRNGIHWTLMKTVGRPRLCRRSDSSLTHQTTLVGKNQYVSG
ncbi:hypothetical protein DPMN_157133 [Dreissena polymorpha]|uniref:Uncharacterized protein n=1 Tax=Dreissena polymorpha TaxID=45954 RepID=A0A9D4ILZ6_DREPO|nr:hypothetical protein DPMN_157133 [Dreissena polymorpha]